MSDADQAEQLGRARRVALDAHAPVDEDRGDVVRVDQVLQVVVDAAGLVHLLRQLGIDRGQLLVSRLQFLAAGLQLLAGRAQLLVQRLQFLVRGHQLLSRGLGMFDHLLQLPLQALVLELQPAHRLLASGRCRPAGRPRPRPAVAPAARRPRAAVRARRACRAPAAPTMRTRSSCSRLSISTAGGSLSWSAGRARNNAARRSRRRSGWALSSRLCVGTPSRSCR